MKKCVKSCLSLVIVVLSVFQFGCPVIAHAAPPEYNFSERLNSLLAAVYDDAEGFGLDRDELAGASLGTAIFGYELVSGRLQKLDYTYYPIISNGKILFFAIDDGNGLSLTECYAKELSVYVNKNIPIALIYDRENCYVVTKEDAEMLVTFGDPITSRDTFSTPTQVVEYAGIFDAALTTVRSEKSISIEPSVATVSVNTDVSLLVPFVSQHPPEDSLICWAASIACIGNYLTGKSYTAVDIAQSLYGTNNYNKSTTMENIGPILHHNYTVYYDYYGYGKAPSESLLVNNISKGYPVYARWWYENRNGTKGYHATVIRGIYQSVNAVFIMDPEYGFSVGEKSNGTFTYVSAIVGNTLTLDGYCSAYT